MSLACAGGWVAGARRHVGAVAVLLCFVAIGTCYSVINPIFEAPDELMHYPYVKQLADGGGLPVQGSEGDALWVGVTLFL